MWFLTVNICAPKKKRSWDADESASNSGSSSSYLSFIYVVLRVSNTYLRIVVGRSPELQSYRVDHFKVGVNHGGGATLSFDFFRHHQAIYCFIALTAAPSGLSADIRQPPLCCCPTHLIILAPLDAYVYSPSFKINLMCKFHWTLAIIRRVSTEECCMQSGRSEGQRGKRELFIGVAVFEWPNLCCKHDKSINKFCFTIYIHQIDFHSGSHCSKLWKRRRGIKFSLCAFVFVYFVGNLSATYKRQLDERKSCPLGFRFSASLKGRARRLGPRLILQSSGILSSGQFFFLRNWSALRRRFSIGPWRFVFKTGDCYWNFFVGQYNVFSFFID